MASVQIVDLDDILWSWASDKLGDGYALEKVDTSKVTIYQRSVLYQSSGDWWNNNQVNEEYFDNNENRPVSWNYNERVQFDSKAVWNLVKAFKSAKLLPTKITLEFPVAPEGEQPLRVSFDSSAIEQTRKAAARTSEWDLSSSVKVSPYSSSHACAMVRTCRLNDVMFVTDVQLSGTLKITGHKKKKKMNKHEVTASIVDALSNKEPIGFSVYENPNDPSGPARVASFRVEGYCSGEVGIGAELKLSQMESAV